MNLKSTVWDLAGVAAAALFTAVAQADTFYWMNKDGGEWSEPSNWRIGSSTGEVATCKPGLGDTATIRSDQLKTSYTIHLSEDVDVAAFIYFPPRFLGCISRTCRSFHLHRQTAPPGCALHLRRWYNAQLYHSLQGWTRGHLSVNGWSLWRTGRRFSDESQGEKGV